MTPRRRLRIAALTTGGLSLLAAWLAMSAPPITQLALGAAAVAGVLVTLTFTIAARVAPDGVGARCECGTTVDETLTFCGGCGKTRTVQ